jgi:thiol-disulfide isomerase/thioredoxin
MRYLPLTSLLLTGCFLESVAPVQEEKQVISNPVPIVTPTPIPSEESITAEVDKNIVESLHRYLGDKNRVELTAEHVIKQPDTEIRIPAGASLNYMFSDTTGEITFNDPKPMITVQRWGFKFHPTLNKVALVAPNKGEAEVQTLGQKIHKSFLLQWQDTPSGSPISVPPSPSDTGTGELSNLGKDAGKSEISKPSEVKQRSRPLLYGFGDTKTCPPCKTAKKQVEELDKPPFDFEWNPEGIEKPESEVTPVFLWADKENLVPQLNETDWKLEGWAGGVKHLVNEFERTRKLTKPRKPKSKARITTRSRCQVGFAGAWVEMKLGYTSVHHLVYDHGLSYESLRPYVNDRNALNRIHGWCHLRETL